MILNSTDEKIKARMVESLASDTKLSSVAVHIDARHAAQPTGHNYKRPTALRDPESDQEIVRA